MDNMALFEKFNEMFGGEEGLKGLQSDIAEAGKPMEKVKVPHGDYEVAITKLELGENDYQDSPSYGCPQVKVWFKVVAGDYKGQLIFMQQNIYGQYAGFQIHNINDFLESLESGIDISFVDFNQYDSLLKNVFKAIDGNYEYQLAYGQNNKGYSTYNIVQKFQK